MTAYTNFFTPSIWVTEQADCFAPLVTQKFDPQW